ncbi:hypothetical protein RS9916_29754 [Synechococcus sp. RS9916]|nr:hypothetical protein RS9916_29754 [Synechococcus sp. RS9916]
MVISAELYPCLIGGSAVNRWVEKGHLGIAKGPLQNVQGNEGEKGR